jgi:NAD(P)-dependent dehydrogenase (short-subunit alcohol dehydrogenase family)
LTGIPHSANDAAMNALPQKVALVTGASRGIGKGIALELAGEGYDLLLTARNAEALAVTAEAVRGRGRCAEIHAVDLRGEGEPQKLVDLAAQQFGRLDIVVNNAGAAGRSDFFKITDAEWRSGFELKFFAQVRLARAAWPLLKASGGSIVTIGGIGGRAPVGDYMMGSSIIGAQMAFMKALADVGKRDGVQVNMVNPGSVDTDRFRHRLGIIMKHTGLDEAAAIEHHRRELEITRFGRPEDIAGLVAFIVSPRGRWLHGAVIDMDGGQVVPLRMSRYD